MTKNTWKVVYFVNNSGKSPIKQAINKLDQKTKIKIFRLFLYLEEYGPINRIFSIKKIHNSDFNEIRFLGKINVRIFFTILEKNEILILHIFIKKTDKTPRKEITITEKRLKIIKQNKYIND